MGVKNLTLILPYTIHTWNVSRARRVCIKHSSPINIHRKEFKYLYNCRVFLCFAFSIVNREWSYLNRNIWSNSLTFEIIIVISIHKMQIRIYIITCCQTSTNVPSAMKTANIAKTTLKVFHFKLWCWMHLYYFEWILSEISPVLIDTYIIR